MSRSTPSIPAVYQGLLSAAVVKVPALTCTTLDPTPGGVLCASAPSPSPPPRSHTHSHTLSNTFAELELPQYPVLQVFFFLNAVFASVSNISIQLKSRTVERTEAATGIAGSAPTVARRTRRHRYKTQRDTGLRVSEFICSGEKR